MILKKKRNRNRGKQRLPILCYVNNYSHVLLRLIAAVVFCSVLLSSRWHVRILLLVSRTTVRQCCCCCTVHTHTATAWHFICLAINSLVHHHPSYSLPLFLIASSTFTTIWNSSLWAPICMCPASTVCVCAVFFHRRRRRWWWWCSCSRISIALLCRKSWFNFSLPAWKNLHGNWALPASVCVMESWWLCCKSVLQLLFSSFLDSPHILFFFFGLLWYTLACWLPQQQQHLFLVRQTHSPQNGESEEGFWATEGGTGRTVWKTVPSHLARCTQFG